MGYLVGRRDYSFNLFIHWMFCTVNIFGCLLITFWVAASVPVELSTFKDAYCKKAHMRMLEAGMNEGPKLERWVLNKPDFVLTGYGISEAVYSL
ncbi:hypothetical protein AVEN_995-1 [Araneus ventricosus]|uniref:Uncharacterized protein n=1 Tax=Araneus ventricosus TaxID=182803 RepID=A0A4Y2CWE1_ARAVE|nr:hypothetical protein AVEN_995-1 [Araneus ventricosus]